jgi:hypothetical protein
VLAPDVARTDNPPSPRLAGRAAGRPTAGANDVEAAGRGGGGADSQASRDVSRTRDGIANRSRSRATFREQRLRSSNETESGPLQPWDWGGLLGTRTAAGGHSGDNE